MRVFPLIVMLTDITGLDLPVRIVEWVERQTTTLEALHEDILIDVGDLDPGPVGLSDWIASCVERTLEERSVEIVATLKDDATRIHEGPENRCNLVFDARNLHKMSGSDPVNA